LSVPVVVGVSVVVFSIVHLLPGDPVLAILSGANATLLNEGKISADVAGGSLRVMPKTFTHHGTAEVLNGAQLTFGGAWNGLGEVAVLKGTFNLDGQFGPLDALITKAAEGIVRITGTGEKKCSPSTRSPMTFFWISDEPE